MLSMVVTRPLIRFNFQGTQEYIGLGMEFHAFDTVLGARPILI